MPHALRCHFINSEEDWRQDELIHYTEGWAEGTASVFEDMDFLGQTSPAQVAKNARFHEADARLRPEAFTWYTDAAYLRCRRGNRVRISHDVILVGIGSARVAMVGVDGEGRVTDLRLDERMHVRPGESYALGWQRQGGQVVERAVAPFVQDGEIAEFSFVDPVPPEIAPSGGELAYFGVAGVASEDLVVTGVRPQRGFVAEITARHYSPELHQIDTGPIPPFQSKITLPRDGFAARPGRPIIYGVRSDESVLLRSPDGTLQPRLVIEFSPGLGVAQVSAFQSQIRLTGGGWRVLPDLPADARALFVSDVEEGLSYDVRLRGVTALGVTGEWAVASGHEIVGKSSPPPDVPGLLVDGRTLRWSYPDPPPDFSGFRLRLATGNDPNWATATPLHGGDWTDTTFRLPEIEGAATVMLRAVDVVGNLSIGTAVVVLALGDIAPANVLVVRDLVSDPVAALDTAAAWGPDSSPAWRPDGEPAWQHNFEALDFEAVMAVSGDLAGSRLTLDMAAAGSGLQVHYRTDSLAPAWDHDSNPAWGPDASPAWPPPPEWQPWPGALESVAAIPLYFRFRASGGPVQGIVESVLAVFDVEDVVEAFEDLTIMESGTRLPITRQFRRIKYVEIDLQDNGLGASGVVIVDKNEEMGPLVRAIGADALIDARVVGY
jgi:hypothetical protein